VSPHKVFDALNYPLDDAKKIKNLVEGATINDAALAIVGGALRTYLQKHKELPDTSLIGWCPVNARKSEAGAPASGNSLSAMTLPIGTDIDDPLQRLKEIRKLTAASKAAESGMGARLLTDMIQHIPSATIAVLARLMGNERFTPKFCNLFLSNVPGSFAPQYMAGAKCTHQYGLAPLGNGMGLFVAVGSYNGSMIFNIISDKNILPDIEFFTSCIDKSFKDYLRLVPKARRKTG
jgi:WS/DGAT/MGAT family acyltransferase